MALIKSKQVSKLLAGVIHGESINFAVGQNLTSSTLNVVTTMTTLLATAGEGGVAVPNRTHFANSAYREGYITSGRNLVQVYTASTDKKILDSNNNEVYGRLVFTGSPAIPATDTQLGTWDGKVLLDAVMASVASSSEAVIQSTLNTAVTNYNAANPMPRNTRKAATYAKLVQGRDYGTSYTASATMMDPMTMMPMYYGSAGAMRGYIISNAGLPAGTMPAGTASTEALSVKFYTSVNGVETAYSFAGGTGVGGTTHVLDLVFPYLFTFEHLPNDFATSLKAAYVNDDALLEIPDTYIRVAVTVTGTNTFTPLATQYNHGTEAILYINGQESHTSGAEFEIDETTDTIVWNAGWAKYNIEVGDEVYLYYSTNGIVV